MKIIDIGICIDNVDPIGIGRIRCIDYDDYVSGKENTKNYKKWSEDDPFIALPFLPNNINFIPEIGQAVKIIRYDVTKTTVNQEYIAGPFTTRFDFNGQTYSQQIAPTTFGAGIKDMTEIVSNGELPADCKGTLPKNEDYSISGKFGSDVVLTENGMVLRGGKMLSKQGATPKERTRMSSYPVSANPRKVAKIQLKKFPEKRVLKKDIEKRVVYETTNLKYIVEYDVDSVTTPTQIKFFIYKVKDGVYGDFFKTNVFNQFTDISSAPVKLLNGDDTTSTATITINTSSIPEFTGLTINQKISVICSEIRTKLLDIKTNGLGDLLDVDTRKKFDSDAEMSNIYPFFFRPKKSLIEMVPSNNSEEERKNDLLTGIKLSKGIQQSGLVWSDVRFSPPSNTKDVITESVVKDNNSREQTFSSIVSDRLLLLSTDTNSPNKSIEFETLNNYEYTQDDYISKIIPNTYAVVRGEVLLQFLSTVYEVLLTHTHNINKPYARADYDAHNRLVDLYNKLENELLNKSVRTN